MGVDFLTTAMFAKDDTIQVTCSHVAEPTAWDDLARSFNGSYFHCHAYAVHAARRTGAEPLFVEAREKSGRCIGIGIGRIRSPHYWPFSQFCRVVTLDALPATCHGDARSQVDIMRLLERELLGLNVFRIEVSSRESPSSQQVLSALSYKLTNRCEFYVDISSSVEDIWRTLKGVRRTDIRKASKLGVVTKVVNTEEGLHTLSSLHSESMQRRDIAYSGEPGHKLQLELMRKGRAVLLVSFADKVPINAALFTLFGESIYYAQSGSSSTGNRMCGPSHLIWTMIEMAKSQGYTSMNLGGVVGTPDASGAENGLYRFKEAFGARAVLQPAGVKNLGMTGGLLDAILSSLRGLRDRLA